MLNVSSNCQFLPVLGYAEQTIANQNKPSSRKLFVCAPILQKSFVNSAKKNYQCPAFSSLVIRENFLQLSSTKQIKTKEIN